LVITANNAATGRNWQPSRLLAGQKYSGKIAALKPEYHQQQHARCADAAARQRQVLSAILTARSAIFSVPVTP